MQPQEVSKITGLPINTVERLMRLSAQAAYNDPEYIQALHKLDADYLNETLPMARAAYEKHIDVFKAKVSERFGLTRAPMSAFTLGNWVVGVLQYPASASELLNMHDGITGRVIAGSLHDLLAMLDDMPEGCDSWKQALTLLSMPLMAK